MTLIYREFLKSIFKNPRQLPQLMLNCWSIYQSSPKASALPSRLHLEQGTLCNLSCRMCPRHLLKRPQGMITYNKFKIIYNQINPLFLNLTGFGESFLNPDILKMLTYAKKHGSYTKIDTNGILINDKTAQAIIRSGIDLISFSIDATNRETYKKIRLADKFDLVIRNLKTLVKMRNQKSSPLKIHVAMVAQKDNLDQVINFIQLMDEIRVDRVNFMYLVEQEVAENKQYLLDPYRNKLKGIITNYQKIKDSITTEVDLLPLEEFAYKMAGLSNKNGACFIPWHSVHITYNGDVQPCSAHYNNQIKMGNVFEEDFKKIWNSAKYQDFRSKLVHNRKQLLKCSECNMNEEYILKRISLLNKIPFLKLLTERP